MTDFPDRWSDGMIKRSAVLSLPFDAPDPTTPPAPPESDTEDVGDMP